MRYSLRKPCERELLAASEKGVYDFIQNTEDKSTNSFVIRHVIITFAEELLNIKV
jgi:hypothetical protein